MYITAPKNFPYSSLHPSSHQTACLMIKLSDWTSHNKRHTLLLCGRTQDFDALAFATLCDKHSLSALVLQGYSGYLPLLNASKRLASFLVPGMSRILKTQSTSPIFVMADWRVTANPDIEGSSYYCFVTSGWGISNTFPNLSQDQTTTKDAIGSYGECRPLEEPARHLVIYSLPLCRRQDKSAHAALTHLSYLSLQYLLWDLLGSRKIKFWIDTSDEAPAEGRLAAHWHPPQIKEHWTEKAASMLIPMGKQQHALSVSKGSHAKSAQHTRRNTFLRTNHEFVRQTSILLYTVTCDRGYSAMSKCLHNLLTVTSTPKSYRKSYILS